ncbi:hypothetical protein [Streptomyces sp. Ag109_O5-10]|uniref:hypothetical protein n=1 Tax=Streptomyces sp. Ag109_O5-10 TaxID=1855349 RepID=UPI0008996652|nr:hypothetical protein [Streptomyces sp. Ag109_O5-10]SEF17139.1 hypothetical protein SAMN05216533_8169 [Streptomyces sp. Ag109_O5-10]
MFEHDLAMRQESAERALVHPDPWQGLVDFLMTREKPTVSSCSSLATSNWAGSTPSRPVPVRGSLRGQPFGCARAEAIGRPERGATDFRAGAGQLS